MKAKQGGLSSVEFALVAPMLFGLILSVVDFGRWMYTWNLLQESTRRVAEAAVVSDPGQPAVRPAVKAAGLLTSDNGFSSTMIPDFTVQHLQVVWLDADGRNIPDASCIDYYRVRFARANLVQGERGYSFKFIMPVDLIGFPREIKAPAFPVTLPRESLGWSGSEPVCDSPV